MGTEILESFGTLQSELEQAKNNLKNVDENIKRLIGRDPSDLPPRPPQKRGIVNEERTRANRVVRGRGTVTEEEPPQKRRMGGSVFKRLSDRPVHYKDDLPNKQMISKVIVTSKEVPSRQEALAAQNSDEKFKARNRRMFGALLGTLQKFQQEETKLKSREDKRAQLERKIEEHEIKEKEEIKKERQGLFLSRKKKQAEIKMIELKMLRMKEYAAWEDRQKPLMNFIKTKTTPSIHYLPRRLNDTSKQLLQNSKADVQKHIADKKQEVFDELQRIEDRMKRNFEEKVLRKEEKHEDHEDEEDDDDDHDEDKHGIEIANNLAKTENTSENDNKDTTTRDVTNIRHIDDNETIQNADENRDVNKNNEQSGECNETEQQLVEQGISFNTNENVMLSSWGDISARTSEEVSVNGADTVNNSFVTHENETVYQSDLNVQTDNIGV